MTYLLPASTCFSALHVAVFVENERKPQRLEKSCGTAAPAYLSFLRSLSPLVFLIRGSPWLSLFLFCPSAVVSIGGGGGEGKRGEGEVARAYTPPHVFQFHFRAVSLLLSVHWEGLCTEMCSLQHFV